jgi:hypothetical protein
VHGCFQALGHLALLRCPLLPLAQLPVHAACVAGMSGGPCRTRHNAGIHGTHTLRDTASPVARQDPWHPWDPQGARAARPMKYTACKTCGPTALCMRNAILPELRFLHRRRPCRRLHLLKLDALLLCCNACALGSCRSTAALSSASRSSRTQGCCTLPPPQCFALQRLLPTVAP